VPVALILALLGGERLAVVHGLAGPRPPAAWWGLTFLISLAGLAIRGWTLGVVPSGDWARHRYQRAAELSTEGPYSVVRHPLYLGNVLNATGMLLAPAIPWLGVILALLLALFIGLIILAEDRYLGDRFGDRHAAWASRTPLLVPDPRLWRPARRPLDPRRVASEYLTLHTVVLVFLLAWQLRRPEGLSQRPSTVWIGLLAANFALWVGARLWLRRLRSGA
jgi:protein-S-isoprenylcysteine O-methyltransferase Ste14